MGWAWGYWAAALATLLGRVFAAAWVFWQQQQIENPLCIRHIADMKPDGDLIRRILGIGIPSGLENGMFQIGKLCVSSLTFHPGHLRHCGQRGGPTPSAASPTFPAAPWALP